MAPPEFEPDRILRVLSGHKVRFVLIGGLAARAHGSPYLTEDVDITPDLDPANLARLSHALSELGAKIRAEGLEDGVPFAHDAESLAAVMVWNLTTPFGDLDISLRPSGTQGYADLATAASDSHAFGVVISIASLADVIRSKQAADRDKDRLVLPVLREILARKVDGS